MSCKPGQFAWRITPRAVSACFAVLAVIAPSVSAQQSLRVEIDSLRTPASPAFVLMGVAPAAIERPSTLRAVAVSAVSALHRSGGLIPEDYAVEIAPYWLRSRPAVPLELLRDNNPLSTLLRTFGISFATTQYEIEVDDGAATRGTRIGAGTRFMLFEGKPSPIVDVLLDSLRALHSQCIVRPEPQDEACIEDLPTQDVALEIQRELRDPDGFVLEVASAIIGDFPNDVFELGRLDRVGIWVTPGFRLHGSDLEIMGVARYIHEKRDVDANLLDAGGRLGWVGSRFAVAGEAVQRYTSVDGDSESRYRVTGTIEARLGESLLASFTFGKGYEPAESDPSGRDRIIATLGIAFGAGPRPVITLPLTSPPR